MSPVSNHHRANHRSRLRRLALPAAVVLGLTLAAQWSNPFDSAKRSTARAESPSPARKKVEPRVVDFNKLAKQKAEARRLMAAARQAAANGDYETARHRADQADAIPVEWNLGETSPKKFLEDLQSDMLDPQQSFEPVTKVFKAPPAEGSQRLQRQHRAIEIETPHPATVGDREVIELSFPDDRPGAAETAEEDLSLMDEPPALRIKRDEPTRSTTTETPKSLRTLGFKNVEPVPSTVESVPDPAAETPRTKKRFAPIPSLEELAESIPFADSSERPVAERAAQSAKKAAATTAKRPETVREEAVREPHVQTTAEPPEPTAARGRSAGVESSPKFAVRDEVTEIQSDPVEPQPFRQFANDATVIPIRPIEDSTSDEPPHRNGLVLPSRRSRTRESLDRSLTTSATEELVAYESRVAERPAPVEQTANTNSGSASQLLTNLNSLMMAGLCAGLLLLVVEALVLLRKLRPNPEFKFKVEVNHPHAAAVSEPIAQVVAPITHVAPIAEPVPAPYVVPLTQAVATPYVAPISQAAPTAYVAPITQDTPTADVISIAQPAPIAKVAPIYALKRQMEEAIEHHQEDAMMRQVFDDNLKLREQLEDSRIAA